MGIYTYKIFLNYSVTYYLGITNNYKKNNSEAIVLRLSWKYK